MMSIVKKLNVALCAAVLIAGAMPAAAQQAGSTGTYPNRALRMVMPFPPGGPTDILGRLLAQRLGEALGQNVLVDNRSGGGGAIGGQVAAKSPPDGYTLFLGGITTLGTGPFIHKNLPFDPLKDFQTVTQTTLQPLMLMVHPSLPVKNVKDYIALAKKNKGQINYATSGPAGSGHLAGELFNYITQAGVVHIPYKGAPPALQDLVAGQVQSMFGTMLAAVPVVRSGKIRAIAITGPKRSIALPDVMTFAEGGLPQYDASSWNGILVPTGTPRPIVDKLNVELVKILKDPKILERLVNDGPIAIGGTPEEFTAFIKSEQAKWSKVIKAADIRIE
jgi:tripartite-type tricarboxylate transporter receptor subunit TctC